MRTLFTYLKTQKGMTLVYLAILLAVLLMLAGVAIDLAYMYNVKNQLQAAADAAALAGTEALWDSSVTPPVLTELNARQQAWLFGCRNKATRSNVYLATDSGNCDTVPYSLPRSGLNDGNDPAGDIVLGNWDPARPRNTVPCDDERFLPTVKCDGTVVPLPSGASFNAVKAVARRTSDAAISGVSMGSNPIDVFLGRIFRVMNIDWSLMSAKATSVAARPPRASQFITMCLDACASCSYPLPSPPPSVCVSERVLESGTNKCHDGGDTSECYLRFAWTSLLEQVTSTSDLRPLICSEAPAQQVCNEDVWTTMGAETETLRELESVMYDRNFDKANKSIDINGNVTGWQIIVPITSDCPPGAQGAASDPKNVSHYAHVHVRAICVQGTTGCHGVEDALGVCAAYPNNVIVIDNISCVPCGDPSLIGASAVLVK